MAITFGTITWGPVGYRPAFFPDGKTVIYESRDAVPVLMLWDTQTDKTQAFLNPAWPNMDQTRPDVSLGTGQVVFVTTTNAGTQIGTAYATGKWNTFVINALGLTYPCWFPGGTTFAATQISNQSLVKSSTNTYPFPAISPSGFYVGMASINQAAPNLAAFAGQRIQQGQKYNQDDNQIWQLDIAAAEASLLIEEGQGRAPWWSYDGSLIAFESNSRSTGGYAIYIAASDGSQVTQVTDTGIGAEHAKFSPDGTKMVFAAKRNGKWHIATVPTPALG